MKTFFQLTTFFFATMTIVACSSGSSGSATTASTTAAVCYTAAGVATTCNETNAANSGTQVVADGSSTTNPAQVPSTAVVQAQLVSRVSDAQIVAKAAEVRAQEQRITDDPNSGIQGSSAVSPVAATTASVSGESISSFSSPVALEISRGPSSISSEGSSTVTSVATPASSGGNGSTVW
jgi:hypothetical protein